MESLSPRYKASLKQKTVYEWMDANGYLGSQIRIRFFVFLKGSSPKIIGFETHFWLRLVIRTEFET